MYGRLELVDHRGARHAHHLRHDHAGQRQHRHREGAQQLAERLDVCSRRTAPAASCSCTAKTSTASVATRNSGTETTATAPVEATRSNHEPRHTAAEMPSVSAIGTENKRGDGRQQQRVGQPAGDQLGHRQLGRRRNAEVAAHQAAQPAQVALGGPARPGPSARAARPAPRGSRPGRAAPAPRRRAARAVMANTTTDTASSDSSASADALHEQLEEKCVHRRCTRVRRRATRARRSCSPSGRRAGSATGP